MSCELKYRFTSLLCKIVNNNMRSLQGTDRSFFVQISFFLLFNLFNYFTLNATSRGNDSNGELKGLLMFHLLFWSLPFRQLIWKSHIVAPLAYGETIQDLKTNNSFVFCCTLKKFRFQIKKWIWDKSSDFQLPYIFMWNLHWSISKHLFSKPSDYWTFYQWCAT